MCQCVVRKEILANMERGFQGLQHAQVLPDSPLLKWKETDLWITSSKEWFTAHLRFVAIRQPPRWGFRVCTDADLMQAWLATVALKGHEIYDADSFELNSRRSMDYLTLVDIALPPPLLIIRLGVKAARNVAMPEVLLEALRHRSHEGKPTWVWDQPDYPLAEGHLSWSPSVAEEISGWKHVVEGDLIPQSTKKARATAHRAPTSEPASIRDMWLKRNET